MFVSDAFIYFRDKIKGGPLNIVEFDTYFTPFLDRPTSSSASGHLAAASCFLLLQMNMWERVVLALDDPERALSIVAYNHGLVGFDARPLPPAFEARKLPTADGQLRLELTPVEDARAFVAALAPQPFLFVVASSVDVAQGALDAWIAWETPAAGLAILIEAPRPDLDPFLAAVRDVPHRVAGWLDIPGPGGDGHVVTMFVFGAGRDEI